STGFAHGRGLGGCARLASAECGGAKRGPTHERCARLAGYIARGLTAVHDVQEAIRAHVDDVRAIQATLASDGGTCAERQAQFQVLRARFGGSEDRSRHTWGRVMRTFAPGWLVGGEEAAWPRTTSTWNAGFASPKGTNAAYTATGTPGYGSSRKAPRC